MKIFQSSCCKIALAAMSAITLPLTLSNCGGGSSNDGAANLVRPQTLDGLTLSLNDNTITLAFTRSSASIAASNTVIEDGAIAYSVNNEVVLKNPVQALNVGGVDVSWPETIGSISYTYTPINSISGILSITTSESTYLFDGLDPSPRSGTGQSDDNVYHFARGTTPNTTNFTLTFTSSNGFIDNVEATIRPASLTDVFVGDLPDNPVTITLDQATTIHQARVSRTVSGSSVQVNYSETRSLNEPSPLVLQNLGTRSVFLTPTGSTLAARSFECSTTTAATNSLDNIESGNATVRTRDPGDATATTVDAGTYTYQTTNGTDVTTFTITSSTVPATTETIQLTFRGAESDSSRANGDYTITSGTSAGQQGTFIVRNGTGFLQ